MGVIRGKTTFQKHWNRLQPSIIAACSKSRGTVLIKPVTAVRLMDICKPARATMNPMFVLTRPALYQLMYSGSSKHWKGISRPSVRMAYMKL